MWVQCLKLSIVSDCHVGFLELRTNLWCYFPCRGGAQLQRWKWEPPATTVWILAGFLRKHSTRSVRMMSLPALTHFLCGLIGLCSFSCLLCFCPSTPHESLPVFSLALVLLMFWCRTAEVSSSHNKTMRIWDL